MLIPSNVKVYTTTSSSSCRKAIHFFKDNQIAIEELRLNNVGVSVEEVILFAKLAGGFNEILAERSHVYKEELVPLMNLETTTTNDVIQFIVDNPRVLKTPIITDGKKIEIGYNEDDVRTFLPRALKRQIFIEKLNYAHSGVLGTV